MQGGGLPFEDAKTQLGKLSADQKQVELGRRAINRSAVRYFRCVPVIAPQRAWKAALRLALRTTRGEQFAPRAPPAVPSFADAMS